MVTKQRIEEQLKGLYSQLNSNTPRQTVKILTGEGGISMMNKAIKNWIDHTLEKDYIKNCKVKRKNIW